MGTNDAKDSLPTLRPGEARSLYENIRRHRNGSDAEDLKTLGEDEENLQQNLDDLNTLDFHDNGSRLTIGSATPDHAPRESSPSSKRRTTYQKTQTRWNSAEDDGENDVPASLLMENNNTAPQAAPISTRPARTTHTAYQPQDRHALTGLKEIPEPAFQYDISYRRSTGAAERRPQPAVSSQGYGRRSERAMWRWVNTTNLDSFIRDVYDYYEGGGIWCILCSNALWLLETLFVATLLTFLTQCVDYKQVPLSKSLHQVVIPQCTRKMSGIWNTGIWLYSFFFIWKSVQYFFEIRRLTHIRDFYVYLLEIPQQDMQTVSWQDIVARIMGLRDQNPKTAANIPAKLRRFMGSQSKERLDAHDIANRLMRKENYLIALINKDVLNLSLPIPFFRNRQLFSRTMEWYLHYGILDMAFNELGQVQQDFLRADRRRALSEKLKQRLYFAGVLNLLFAPVVLAYVMIVYFFTYYNEYQKDPKLAAARKYTALAEWKFREFNELPHIFYERLHMSFPFATRYVDQFPKRMTEEIARSIAFISGAITAVLAVCTVLDSELFLGFEITKDRTVLFYLGVFGAVWAMTRGMVSEEATVFNPEYALRNVIEYTHFMPDHWNGRLHSFEVKQEFSELYKMKVVIFLEEVMGIITTPLLLLISLPRCSDQIVDFFREFTIHVDGLGYVCSFAVFDFRKGVGVGRKQDSMADVREDYYTTKHGKMAASYYGFLDNYVINPRTGIPGHMPPGIRHQFHQPPVFPSLNSPTLAADLDASHGIYGEGRQEPGNPSSSAVPPPISRTVPKTVTSMAQPSPMGSLLLDPRYHPTGTGVAVSRSQRSRRPSALKFAGTRGTRIMEESSRGLELSRHPDSLPEGRCEDEDEGGILGESVWETSPSKGLSRENSAANTTEPEAGVLGLIYQLRQTQHARRGSSVV